MRKKRSLQKQHNAYFCQLPANSERDKMNSFVTSSVQFSKTQEDQKEPPGKTSAS